MVVSAWPLELLTTTTILMRNRDLTGRNTLRRTTEISAKQNFTCKCRTGITLHRRKCNPVFKVQPLLPLVLWRQHLSLLVVFFLLFAVGRCLFFHRINSVPAAEWFFHGLIFSIFTFWFEMFLEAVPWFAKALLDINNFWSNYTDMGGKIAEFRANSWATWVFLQLSSYCNPYMRVNLAIDFSFNKTQNMVPRLQDCSQCFPFTLFSLSGDLCFQPSCARGAHTQKTGSPWQTKVCATGDTWEGAGAVAGGTRDQDKASS